MFIIKRNQVIVTALVVMVAVAGYLNLTEVKNTETDKSKTEIAEDITLSDDGEIVVLPDDEDTSVAETNDNNNVAVFSDGETEFDPITAEAIANEEIDDTGAAVLVGSDQNADFFVTAKLEREQTRSKEKDLLTEIINNKNIEQEQKDACAEQMLDIQKRIEKESAAEAMIKSKGFSEAYVRIDDETVDVVVNKPDLKEDEVAQIMDIVKRKTGFPEDKIRISPLK